MSDSDEREPAPTDTFGVIYSHASNVEAGRDSMFGRRELDAATQASFDKLFMDDAALSSAMKGLASGQSTAEMARMRGVMWRVLLGLLPTDTTTWAATLTAKRQEYADLMEKYRLDPSKVGDADPLLCNPLSLEPESPWQEFYKNQELLHDIELDMTRLYPDGAEDFFEAAPVRHSLVNVLFVWCRMHPDTSYRQGMHELVAPLYFVLEGEKLRPSSVPDGAQDSPLVTVCDPLGVEADTFWLFMSVMDDVAVLYSREGGSGDAVAGSGSEDEGETKVSDAVTLCNRVQYEFLHRAAPDVASALRKLTIQPQVYALRWMRLLFGREFQIHDVMGVWDAIFAAKFGVDGAAGISILDTAASLSVAMLLFIRDDLVSDDYGSVLGALMRFPELDDHSVLIQRAAELRASHYAAPPPTSSTPAPAPNAWLVGRKVVDASVGRTSDGGNAWIMGRPTDSAASPTAPAAVNAFTPASAPAPAPAASVLDVDDNTTHRVRLIKFYTMHNPAKLANVDTILTKYRGRETQLFQHLARRYGLPVSAVVTPPVASHNRSVSAPVAPSVPSRVAPRQAAAPSPRPHLFGGSWGGPAEVISPPPTAPTPPQSAPRAAAAAAATPVVSSPIVEAAVQAGSAEDRRIMQLCGARIEAVASLGEDALPFLQEIADVLLRRTHVSEVEWA